MAKQVLVENASGWITPLPDAAKATISHRWPTVSLEWIESEFGNYLLIRDALHRQPEPAEIRARYDAMRERVSLLKADVDWLRRNNLGLLMLQSVPPQYYDNLANVAKDLSILAAILPRAEKYLPEGHQMNPRHVLVDNVARAVQRAGLDINARPQGALCSIVGTLIEAAGEKTSSVVAIVKPVVARLKKSA